MEPVSTNEQASAELAGGEHEYRVVVSGFGLTLDRAIPEALAREIMNVVLGGGVGVSRPDSISRGQFGSRSGLGDGTVTRSLREYMDSTGAKRNPEKILTIGAYLIDEGGASGFDRDDIKAQFRSAGEPLPGNFARDFAAAVTSGWVAEDHNSGQFYVTRKGRDVIDQQFSADVRRVNRPTRRRRKQRKANGESESE